MEENAEPTQQAPQTPDSTEAPPVTPTEQEISQNSKNLAMLCHLLGLLTNFLGPLNLWIIKKEEDEFVNEQGKEALNFQITLAIAYIVGTITSFFCVGFILIAIAGVADLVFCIMACLAASKGEHYRYPASIRLIK